MMTDRRFTRGDRVRLIDGAECGTVVATGAILADDYSRIETCRVMWPVGADVRTAGTMGDPLTRWHAATDLDLVP